MTDFGKIKSYDTGNGKGTITPERGGDALGGPPAAGPGTKTGPALRLRREERRKWQALCRQPAGAERGAKSAGARRFGDTSGTGHQPAGLIFSREPGARKRPRLTAPPSMQSDSEMNVNQLLHNHQLARLKAQHAHSRGEREVNSGLISHYAQQITVWRKSEGLSEAGWPHAQRSCLLADQ